MLDEILDKKKKSFNIIFTKEELNYWKSDMEIELEIDR